MVLVRVCNEESCIRLIFFENETFSCSLLLTIFVIYIFQEVVMMACFGTKDLRTLMSYLMAFLKILKILVLMFGNR